MKKIKVNNELLENFGGNLIFECNLHEKDVKEIIPKSGFLQDIVVAWCKINFKHSEIENISKEITWNNTFIKSNGKMFFEKSWFDRGIQLIEHIYDFRKKEFYNFNELLSLYDLPKKYFLFYNSLISSISKEWKSKLKVENEYNYQRKETLLHKTLNKRHVNKFLYQQQLQKEEIADIKHESKWTNIFEENNLNWKDIYITPIKPTIDTKLRDFQYKFITRILPTNTFLYKCKISNSNLCDFCCRDIRKLLNTYSGRVATLNIFGLS